MMTTSKRISLLFAGYVTILILIFGIAINVIFFLSWYRIIDVRPDISKHTGDINMIGSGQFVGNKFDGPPPQFQDLQLFERLARPMLRGQQPVIITNEEFTKILSQRTDWFDLISYENQIYHYRIDQQRGVVLTLVDHLIDSQLLLVYITLTCALLFAGLSYIISLWLVKRGLRPLYQLTNHIKQVKDPEEYENLNVGPEHDELQEVSLAFGHAMNTIAMQTRSLKQFVSHASHELKTPLMTISSAVDVLKKRGENSKQLITIKDTTVSMKHLIDRLLKTMRYDTIEKQNVDIVGLVRNIIDREQILRPEVSVISSLPSSLMVVSDPTVLESIITNLITNAYKYAVPKTSLDIQIFTGSIKISNIYDVEQKPDLAFIREPFYRADESRTDGTSHGLGLTIVRQLVERLGWSVNAQFDNDRIIFTLIWSE